MVTAAEADIEKKAASVPPGTFRHTVLVAAKRFKSTWAELGKLLVQVRDEGTYQEWGYPSFEAYCLKELHIRKATALKLTRSFSFLSRHEPRDGVQHQDFGHQAPSFEAYCLKELHIKKQTALKLTRSFSFLAKHEAPEEVSQPDFPQKAPAFEVIEVLADAEERGQLSPTEYRSLRDSIWNPEKPPNELKKEFAERFPKPPPEPPPESFQVRKLAQMARKLAAEVSGCRRVPHAIAERAGALAEDLEELASSVNDA
jgi:hypothetical protein